MATYQVQLNDTPALIAQKLRCSSAMLIAANPQKQQMIIDGSRTFRSLSVGEFLVVPAGCGVQIGRRLGRVGVGDVNSDAAAVAQVGSTAALCVSGNPTVMACQTSYNAANPSTPLTVDGSYGPATAAAMQATLNANPVGAAGVTAPAACTSYTSAGGGAASAAAASSPAVIAAANAVIADTTICNAGSNANVVAFQTAYNGATGSTLAIDGLYGPATYAAMQSVATVASPSPLSAAPPVNCANFTPPPGGGGSAAPFVPAPIVVTPGATPVSNTTNVAVSSMTPLVIGLVVVAGGLAAFYYLDKHKAGASTHPMLPAHRARRR